VPSVVLPPPLTAGRHEKRKVEKESGNWATEKVVPRAGQGSPLPSLPHHAGDGTKFWSLGKLSRGGGESIESRARAI